MVANTFTHDVDIKVPTYLTEPLIRQNDTVTFILNITDDGVPYDLSDVLTATYVVERPDGVNISYDAKVISDSNQVSCAIARSAITVPGKSRATIQLYGANNRVSTLSFLFNVQKDPTGRYSESDAEKTLIEVVLGDGPLVIAEAQTATTEAVTAIQKADTATEAANLAAGKANAATTNADTATADAITSTNAANLATEKANTAADNADTKAGLAETATTNANLATESANTAADLANTAAILADEATEAANTVATENKTRFLPAVATIAERDTTYPNPDHGDTVRVTAEAKSYRYVTGSGWVVTDEYNPTAIDEVTRQLAETEKQTTAIFSKSNSNRSPVIKLASNKSLKPIVTFIDDDGNRSLLTKLTPISERQGVPFVGAFVGDALETGLSVTTEEALDLQNRLGWEIASHSQTHLGLQTAGLTDEDIEYETRYSSEFMRERGLDVKNFVYPGGQYDPRAKRIVSKYYNCAIGTDARINSAPHITYNLGRLAFPQPSPNNTLAYYKSKVDEAVANNSWLIWMMHCGQSDFTLEQEQILEDLIEYIKSINVEILTVQQALDKSGNIISVNDNQFYMSADGKNNMVNYITAKRDTVSGVETLNPDMLPSNFELGKTYTSEIFTTNMRAKFPTNKPGVFTVVMTHNVQQSYQRFLDVDGAEFVRYATASNTWGAWKRFFVGDKLTVSLTVGNVPAGSGLRKTVSVNGLSADTMFTANPKFTVPSGITFSCTFVNSWVLGIEFFNSTGAAIDMGSGDWNIFMVR